MSERRKRRAKMVRFRKTVQQIFPWILVGVILLIGHKSVDLVKRILPDFRDKIVSFNQPDKNSLIYLQSDHALSVYPWNEYDQSRTVPYTAYVQRWIWEQMGLEPEEATDALAIPELKMEYKRWEAAMRNICEGNCYHLTRVFVPWGEVSEFGDVYGAAVWSESTLYLKDHAIVLTSATSETAEYLVDFSMDMSGEGVFYHCRETDRRNLTEEEINVAYETVQRDLETIRDIVTGVSSQPVSMEDNLFLRVFDRVEDHIFSVITDAEWLVASPLAEYATAMEQLIADSLTEGIDCDIIVYEGELMLIFDGEKGERLILYYDIDHGEINGVSFRI